MGKGKGLDVVDVKATVRHKTPEEQDEKVKELAAELEEKNRVKLSPEWKRQLQHTKTIRLQCKDDPKAAVKSGGSILLIKPRGSSTSSSEPDTIYLEDLFNAVGGDKRFRLLQDWLELLLSDLKNIEKGSSVAAMSDSSSD